MSKKTTFDYREFLEKGFETLDDDFLDQHFGSSSSSKLPVESSNNKAGGFHHSTQFKYPIVKTLAKQEVKPSGGTPPYMVFHGSKFTQHFLQNLSQTQKRGLKNGRGYVDVPLLDDNTGQFYNTKLVFQGDFCYLVEMTNSLKRGNSKPDIKWHFVLTLECCISYAYLKKGKIVRGWRSPPQENKTLLLLM